MGPPSDPRIELRLEPGAQTTGSSGPIATGCARSWPICSNNAVHFTPPAGTVRVVLAGAAGRVTIQISDDGRGMPPDELQRAFEFGFRGAAAKELGVPGMGLGLWVCRALAVGLGGSVDLQSTAGEGTTATVVLPAMREP